MRQKMQQNSKSNATLPEDLYWVSQMVHHESVKTTQKYGKRKRRLADSPVFGLKFF
jgi:ribosomal protein L17